MDHINTSEYSPAQKYPQNPMEPITMVPANRRDPQLDGGNSKKIGGM